MKKKIRAFVIIWIFLLLMLVASCTAKHETEGSSTYSSFPTPMINDDQANQVFFDLIAGTKPLQINSGITIQRIETVSNSGTYTPYTDYFPLLILNHTSEAVKFRNIGFAIQVFQYDPSSKDTMWEAIQLPYVPEETEKILPPELEKFDFQIVNSWELFGKDLVNVKTNIIRVYVSGEGVDTHINYGAFIDLQIKK